jgi:hypothetical protein
MRCTAWRQQYMVPKTLMANMRCSRAASISTKRAPWSTTPALLARPASGPKSRSSTANIALHLGVVGHVGLQRDGAPALGAHVLRHRFGRGRIARVVDGHVPAAGGGQPGRGSANAAAATGDEQDGVHHPMLGRLTLG